MKNVVAEPVKSKPSSDLLNDYCSSATVHGVLLCSLSKSRASKRFWALMIFIGTLGTIYELYDIGKRYSSSPTATSIGKVFNQTMKYPDILLCDMNYYNRSYWKTKNVSDRLFSYISNHFYQNFDEYRLAPNIEEAEEEYKNLLEAHTKTNDIREFLREGHNCEVFLKFCSLKLYDQFDCCSIAEKNLHPRYGVCYMIPASRWKQLTADQGIFITMEIQQSDSGIF